MADARHSVFRSYHLDNRLPGGGLFRVGVIVGIIIHYPIWYEYAFVPNDRRYLPLVQLDREFTRNRDMMPRHVSMRINRLGFVNYMQPRRCKR